MHDKINLYRIKLIFCCQHASSLNRKRGKLSASLSHRWVYTLADSPAIQQTRQSIVQCKPSPWVQTLSLVSIHVLAGRTTARDASRCMDTNDHSLRNKSLRARNKVAHVELLRGLVLRYAVIYRNQQRKKKKISCPPEKKSKAKNNDNVRKVVISDKMQEAKKNFCPPKKRAKLKTNKK